MCVVPPIRLQQFQVYNEMAFLPLVSWHSTEFQRAVSFWLPLSAFFMTIVPGMFRSGVAESEILRRGRISEIFNPFRMEVTLSCIPFGFGRARETCEGRYRKQSRSVQLLEDESVSATPMCNAYILRVVPDGVVVPEFAVVSCCGSFMARCLCPQEAW